MKPSRTKSRTFRRIFKRVPSGKNRLFYVKRKPSAAKCTNCGAVLKGVLRERPYKMMTISKTKKRPERPYGGVLCSACLRAMIKQKSRSQ